MTSSLGSVLSTRTTRLVLAVFCISAIAFGGFFVPIASAEPTPTTLTVLSPNGGEEWRGTRTITWGFTGGNPGDLVNIVYTTNEFGTQSLVAENIPFDDGTYSWDTNTVPDADTYKIKVISSNGIVFDQSDSVFTVDNTDPVTTLTTDPATPNGTNGWFVTTPTLTLTCDDGADGGGCYTTWYRWNGGMWVNNATTSVTALEGSNLLEWYSDDQATDAAGVRNVETVKSATIKVDTIEPTVAITSTTADGAYNAGDAINITLTFSEAATSTDTITVNLDSGGSCEIPAFTNQTVVTCDYIVAGGQNSVDLTVTSLDLGTGTVKDDAGNDLNTTPTVNLAATRAIVVDTTAPGGFTTGAIVTTGGTAVANWWNSTNTGVNVTVPVANDTSLVGGTIQVEAEADGTFEPLGAAYAIEVADLDGDKTLSFTAAELEALTGFGEGDNVTFRAVITDLAGNGTTGTASASDLDVDQTLPSVDAGDDQETKTQVSQDATTSDGGSGLATHQWAKDSGTGTISFGTATTVDTTIQSDTNGTFVLSLTVTDAAGNSNSDTMTFVWDTIAPVLTEVTPVPSPSNDTSPSYTFSIDSVGWLTGSTGTIDYGLGSCGSGDLTVVQNGNNTTTYGALSDDTYTDCDIIVTDFAGNVSNTLEVNDFEVDTDPAEIMTVTTEDTDADGSIDTATLVFDDEINDSTILLADFAIEGVNPTAMDTGTTTDDTTIILTFGTQIDGTEKKTLNYTSSASDLAGNDIAPFSELSIDAAGPVPISAQTKTTTSIDVTFSEDLNGSSDSPADFFVDVDGDTVSDVTATSELDGIVTLTLGIAMGTGDTPLIDVFGDGSSGLQDSAGNWTPQDYLDILPTDGVAPVLNDLRISSNNAKDGSLWAKMGDTVTITATSSESVATPVVTIAGNTAAVSGGPTEWYFTYTMQVGDAEGPIAFTVDIEDLAGNTNAYDASDTTDASSITYDRTNPVVSAGDDNEINQQFTQTSADASDVGSGIDFVVWTETSGPGTVTFDTADEVMTDISTNTDGTYVLRLTAEDEAGNTASDEMTLIWDTLAPRFEFMAPAHGSTGNSIDAGTLLVHFRQANGAGSDFVTLLDSSKVLLEAQNDGTDAHTGAAGDGSSEVLSVEYGTLESGTTYCLTLLPGAVRDAAGNVTTQDTDARCFTTAVDTAPPVVESFSADSITESGAMLSLATDEDATCKISTIDAAYSSMTAMDSTGGTSHSASITGLDASTAYDYYARCSDGSGNTMTVSAHVSFTTLAPAPDTEAPPAPVITTSANTVNANTYSIAGTVDADTPNDSIRVVTVYNGSDVVGSATVPIGQTGWSVTVTLNQDATNSFTATATDAAGNESGASAAVDIIEDASVDADTTPPGDPSFTTSDTTVDADTYLLEGSVADDGGVRTVVITRSGSAVGLVTLPAGEEDWAILVPLEQETDNAFEATAVDAAGNISAGTDTVTITEETTVPIDAEPPVILSFNPADGAINVANGAVPTITFSEALDPGTVDTDSVKLWKYGSPDEEIDITVALSADGTQVFITPDAALEYATHYYYTVSDAITDVAGNVLVGAPYDDATRDEREFTVQNDPNPVVALAVTGIDAVRTFADDTDDYEDGWEWTFHITVPTDETNFAMRFSDFISGGNSIAAAGNIRYFTGQASANADEGSAVEITAADTYPAGITLDSDLDSNTAGRQVDVSVQVKVPVGSAGGSYSASYGVASS